MTTGQPVMRSSVLLHIVWPMVFLVMLAMQWVWWRDQMFSPGLAIDLITYNTIIVIVLIVNQSLKIENGQLFCSNFFWWNPVAPEDITIIRQVNIKWFSWYSALVEIKGINPWFRYSYWSSSRTEKDYEFFMQVLEILRDKDPKIPTGADSAGPEKSGQDAPSRMTSWLTIFSSGYCAVLSGGVSISLFPMGGTHRVYAVLLALIGLFLLMTHFVKIEADQAYFLGWGGWRKYDFEDIIPLVIIDNSSLSLYFVLVLMPDSIFPIGLWITGFLPDRELYERVRMMSKQHQDRP